MSNVDHPPHYQQVPGIECIDVVEHFPFNRGNAIKYLWRAGAKGDVKEDLKKAIWYITRELEGLENDASDEQRTSVPTQKDEDEKESSKSYTHGFVDT